MRARTRYLIAAVLLGGLVMPIAAQAPDAPPLPRLQGLCRPEDGPQPGWRRHSASSLGVRVPVPAGWSVREAAGGLDLVAPDRVMVRIRLVDTGGRTPLAWLSAQAARSAAARCRAVILGTLQGRQCLDTSSGVWTTYLTTSRRVLAVDAPPAVDRRIHCGILTGIVEPAP